MKRAAGRILLVVGAPLVLLAASEAVLALVAQVLLRSAHAVAGTEGIVCVGDSNTHGFGARSYPDQLQQLLAAAGDSRTVVNLGIPGLRTRHMIPRLEEALREGNVGTVLFLGGVNDFRPDLFLEDGRGSLVRTVVRFLEGLRTVRVLRPALRRRSGSGEEPEPGYLQLYRVKAASGEDRLGSLFGRFLDEWGLEEGEEAALLFERLLGNRGFPRLVDPALVPLVRWELAWLSGGPLPSLPANAEPLFTRYAQAVLALSAGRLEEARDAFASMPAPNPVLGPILGLHRAWVSLLERAFERADRELGAALEGLLEVPATIAVAHGLAGSALAFLLRDEGTRLREWRAGREDLWNTAEQVPHARRARELLLASRWIDARKGGNIAEGEALEALARSRFPDGPRTELLQFLERRPEADFETIRREAPIDPLRTVVLRTPWGVNLLRRLTVEEFEPVIGASLERLAALARERRFRLLVLTYLDPDVEVVNERLRRFARERGFELVDFRAVYGEEILSENRTRYFLPDRHHPNDAGYALVARELFRVLTDEALR